MSDDRLVDRRGNLEYRRSANSKGGYNKVALRSCPICGEDLSDPSPGDVSRHIAEHDPEEFGLSPEGERRLRTDGGVDDLGSLVVASALDEDDEAVLALKGEGGAVRVHVDEQRLDALRQTIDELELVYRGYDPEDPDVLIGDGGTENRVDRSANGGDSHGN